MVETFSILHKEYKTSLLFWQSNYLLCSLMDFGVSFLLLRVFALRSEYDDGKGPSFNRIFILVFVRGGMRMNNTYHQH